MIGISSEFGTKWLTRLHARAFQVCAGAVLAVVALGVAAPSVWAAASPWIDQEQARLRLLAAADTAGAEDTISLGLHFKLEPGWKVYWRSPGDAGYPPQIDWAESQNLAAAEMEWPVPHRFSLFGLQTFGYGDEVVFPIAARPIRPGQAVALRAKVEYLTCNEICIPREAVLALNLPAGSGEPTADGFLIDTFRLRVPGKGPAQGLEIEKAVLTGTLAAPVVEVTARSDRPFESPDVLIEAPPGFSFAAPEISFAEARSRAVLRVAATAAGGGVLEGKRITLTLTDGRRGSERPVVARYAASAAARTGGGPVDVGTFAVILGLAILGGLILNLMPCVLPVLSIKLLSVVKHGGRAPAAVRVSFLASSAGIIASFLVLAGGAILVKSLGLAVGWGIQFQQPLFLTAMAVVVILFACNLFGFYEFGLPRWAQGTATLGQARGGAPREPTLTEHFMTGALATLLATPCSAPFLGTAIGFALARGPLEILSIFAALGLGLALPYLVIAAVPALATRLPRPGPWMVTLRRVLGLALVATAVWLLSVLSAQVGLGGAVAAGALLGALILVVWMGRARDSRSRATAIATPALAGILALATIALPAGLTPQAVTAIAAPQKGDEIWQAFDQAEISRRVAQGEIVIVDVTADWCLTCQVNKKLVLDRDPVNSRIAGEGVTAMRRDWTLPSDEISAYLEGFGRYGIPFDAVYGPGAPGGIALPELLTSEAVLKAFEQAGGG